MAKFLRRKQGGWCRDCYYADKECPDDACVDGQFSYIEDTIIPQKLALYDEMLRSIEKRILYLKFEHPGVEIMSNMEGMECGQLQSIIDRAKKIQEEE